VNYEQIRTLIADAVTRALPIDPDDSTCIVRFEGPADAPVWGAPETVVEAIVTEVMQVLYPGQVPLPTGDPLTRTEEPLHPDGDPLARGRWSCGCDSSRCKLVWTVGRDAGADPTQVIRVTCVTDGLHADSHSARVADNQGMRQQAQALLKLDQAHQEQCR
jgi:hypothetical protein